MICEMFVTIRVFVTNNILSHIKLTEMLTLLLGCQIDLGE